MKLKKIVSLALAGVLAVSMLTACGEGSSSSNTNEENTITTPAAGYSATFAKTLEGAAAKKITMKDDADLTADLNSAIRHLSSSTMDKFYTAFGGSDAIDVVASGFSSLVDVNRMVTDMDAMSVKDAFASLVPSPDLLDEDTWKDETVVMLFVVDSAVDEYAAVEQIASDLNNNIALLNRDNDTTVDGSWGMDHTTLGYTYTGSVSVASKTQVGNATVGVHVVAVEITRTAIA